MIASNLGVKESILEKAVRVQPMADRLFIITTGFRRKIYGDVRIRKLYYSRHNNRSVFSEAVQWAQDRIRKEELWEEAAFENAGRAAWQSVQYRTRFAPMRYRSNIHQRFAPGGKVGCRRVFGRRKLFRIMTSVYFCAANQ